MDDDVQQRLFQSFFSTKGTDGTGIGLVMTKRIVDQHQGMVEVKSRPGEGTTMIIRLPAGLGSTDEP
jgi:signal transduction histidine kinase